MTHFNESKRKFDDIIWAMNLVKRPIDLLHDNTPAHNSSTVYFKSRKRSMYNYTVNPADKWNRAFFFHFQKLKKIKHLTGMRYSSRRAV